MKKFVCIVALFLFVAGASAQLDGNLCENDGENRFYFYPDGNVSWEDSDGSGNGTYSVTSERKYSSVTNANSVVLELDNGTTVRGTAYTWTGGSNYAGLQEGSVTAANIRGREYLPCR
jgi:hypothetical protein